LRYIARSLACFLTCSLTHSRLSRSLTRSRLSRSLTRSRLSRSLARSFSISIHTCPRHCQIRSLTRSRLSRSLARSFSISIHTCLRHCQITSASCVRSCNRTLQDGSTIIIMTITTFLKVNLPKLELCVAISPLIGHVGKK